MYKIATNGRETNTSYSLDRRKWSVYSYRVYCNLNHGCINHSLLYSLHTYRFFSCQGLQELYYVWSTYLCNVSAVLFILPSARAQTHLQATWFLDFILSRCRFVVISWLAHYLRDHMRSLPDADAAWSATTCFISLKRSSTCLMFPMWGPVAFHSRWLAPIYDVDEVIQRYYQLQYTP